MDWATAPESPLLVLRFVTAGLVLGIVFARRRHWRRPPASVRAPPAMGLRRLRHPAAVLRRPAHTSVAIAMFLLFLAPVWVAPVAPRVFTLADRAVVYPRSAWRWPAWRVILVPMLSAGASTSRSRVVAAWDRLRLRGLPDVVKGLTRRVVGA